MTSRERVWVVRFSPTLIFTYATSEGGWGMNDRMDSRGKVAPDTGSPSDGNEGILTKVCVKCGREYYSSDGEPDPDLACGKCGNTVFREYFTHEADDEASEDFRAATERDLAPDDAEGETLPGDLLDLDDVRA